MNSLLEEELKKTNFKNLHESIFTYDPTQEDGNTDYLHANKIGHMVQEMPKIDNLSMNFYKFLKQRERRNRQKSASASGKTYTYEQSQRKLTNEQSTYQAVDVDRTVIFNKFTSSVIEAASLRNSSSANLEQINNKHFKDKDLLLAKIVEITNKKIRVHFKKDEEEIEISNDEIELIENLNDVIKAITKINTTRSEVTIEISMPISVIKFKNVQNRNEIITNAIEDFKMSILHHEEMNAPIVTVISKSARNRINKIKEQRIKVHFIN